MKKLSSIIYIICVALCAATFCSSCDNNLDEEPPVNAGYKTNVRIPDPEELTEEDQALIAAQQKEYDDNKSAK